MRPIDLQFQMDKTTDDRMKLMWSKRHDYADEDALANFKRMQQICHILDINPQQSAGDCARFLMMLKIDRWCNLLKRSEEPANESMRDTLLDLHNYIDLAYASDYEPLSVDLTRE